MWMMTAQMHCPICKQINTSWLEQYRTTVDYQVCPDLFQLKSVFVTKAQTISATLMNPLSKTLNPVPLILQLSWSKLGELGLFSIYRESIYFFIVSCDPLIAATSFLVFYSIYSSACMSKQLNLTLEPQVSAGCWR